jgi:hypothetical protein
VTIKQTIDEVQIARSTAPCADGELTRQMRLGANGKGGNLFMPDMEPLDLSVAADGIDPARCCPTVSK